MHLCEKRPYHPCCYLTVTFYALYININKFINTIIAEIVYLTASYNFKN